MRITFLMIISFAIIICSCNKNENRKKDYRFKTIDAVVTNRTTLDSIPNYDAIIVYKPKEYERQIIKLDSLKNLVVDVVVQYRQSSNSKCEDKVFSHAFENYMYTMNRLDLEADRKLLEMTVKSNKANGFSLVSDTSHLFCIVSDTISLKNTNYMLIAFYSPVGMECNQYFYTLFERIDKNLYLVGIMPKLFLTSFGGLELKKLIQLNPQKYIMELFNYGSDDFVHEEISLCLLELPTNMIELYNNSFEDQMEVPFTKKYNVEYDSVSVIYKIKNFKRSIVKKKSPSEWKYTNWKLINTDTVFCKNYVK